MKLAWPGVSIMLMAYDFPDDDGSNSDMGMPLIDSLRFCSSIFVCIRSLWTLINEDSLILIDEYIRSLLMLIGR